MLFLPLILTVYRQMNEMNQMNESVRIPNIKQKMCESKNRLNLCEQSTAHYKTVRRPNQCTLTAVKSSLVIKDKSPKLLMGPQLM